MATGTTLNIMSLMGMVMMVGIVVSNSILIVEFTNRLRAEGRPLRQAVSLACRVRLRPVLMTSLATLMGLLPMALKLGTGSEAYAPLARAIIGGTRGIGGSDCLYCAGGVLCNLSLAGGARWHQWLNPGGRRSAPARSMTEAAYDQSISVRRFGG